MSVHLTNKPAIIALLHHINDVSLPQLQLILIARHVVVQRLVPGLEKIRFLFFGKYFFTVKYG